MHSSTAFITSWKSNGVARRAKAGISCETVLEKCKTLEAEFSRYLQGVPYWQVPVRRPLWIVHKTRRGIVAGDESFDALGGRVLDVVKRLAREHPGEPMAVVSHADPIQAAWILLDGRAHNEREMYRKQVDRAGCLKLEMEGDRPVSWEYIPPPSVAPLGAAA